MDYKIVKGYRENAFLLWVPSEKHLYSFKVERCGRREYICYNDTLSKPKKKKKGKDHPKCTARVFLKDGILTRNRIAHSEHDTYDLSLTKANFVNSVKSTIRRVQKEFPVAADKITIDEIFFQELAKYGLLVVVTSIWFIHVDRE